MREIMFRAWDGAKFYYFGNHAFTLDYNDVSGWNVRPNLPDYKGAWLCGESQSKTPDFDLQQLTGFSDKDGREIYEGDILTDTYKRRLKVIWRQGRFQFEALKETNFLYADMYQWFDGWTENPEVIGNIYENPEFLKGE